MLKTTMFGADFSLPSNEYYKLLKQVGFDNVVIGWRDDDRLTNLEVARNAGLFIENIHAPTFNSDDFWLDNLKGEDYTERLLASIEDCKIYGIPTMVVHICYSNTPPPGITGFQRLNRITDKAEQNNINIAFENTGATEHIHYIFNNIPPEKLGFCFDSGHQNLMNSNIDCLEEFGSRLMALHLNDNDGNGDMHLLPFDGTVDWNKVTQHLKSIQYEGALAFELFSQKDKYTPLNFYREAFNRANRLLAMINM